MSQTPAPETQPDPAPAVLHRFERPSTKRIKAGLQLVARAGHGKRVCESLRQEARSGRLSEAEFNAKVGQLVGAA
jgi:hypothetical protein